jgi:hypothetical protein
MVNTGHQVLGCSCGADEGWRRHIERLLQVPFVRTTSDGAVISLRDGAIDHTLLGLSIAHHSVEVVLQPLDCAMLAAALEERS